jgi:hypothetical protein
MTNAGSNKPGMLLSSLNCTESISLGTGDVVGNGSPVWVGVKEGSVVKMGLFVGLATAVGDDVWVGVAEDVAVGVVVGDGVSVGQGV